MKLETIRYDDKIARMFFGATLLWAVVGMLVGSASCSCSSWAAGSLAAA